MAGSYNHAVDAEGRLLCNEDLVSMLENGGDVFEAVEEMYGMIWWLAHQYGHVNHTAPSRAVEAARKAYREGLSLSPGVDARLPDGDDED